LGSAAAPTAGLHFTPELLEAISEQGVGIARITLHVGLGTFRPVKVDVVEEHRMHEERFEVTEDTACKVNQAIAGGGRVVAVGTTNRSYTGIPSYDPRRKDPSFSRFDFQIHLPRLQIQGGGLHSDQFSLAQVHPSYAGFSIWRLSEDNVRIRDCS